MLPVGLGILGSRPTMLKNFPDFGLTASYSALLSLLGVNNRHLGPSTYIDSFFANIGSLQWRLTHSLYNQNSSTKKRPNS